MSLRFANTRTLAGSAAMVMRKLRSALRSSAFVKLWLLPVWAMIGCASLLIALLPFRWIAPLLGRHLGTTGVTPRFSSDLASRASQIGITIAIAAKYAPFRSDCLPQAMVAVALCRLYSIPYALHLGCKINAPGNGEARMTAHAWVVSGPIVVSGGRQSFRHYRTVSCWISPGLSNPALGGGIASDHCNP